MSSQSVWAYIHEFSSHLAKEQPARLFHYTPATSALSILRSAELWASSLVFMADTKESLKGLNLSLRLIDKLLERTQIPEPLSPTAQLSYSQHPKKRYALYQHLILTKLRDRLETYLKADNHILILSFSEHPDELSSWKRYAPYGGYSLGFSADHLAIKGAEQSFQLLPCYYADWKDQAVVIQGALLGSLQSWLAQVQELYYEGADLQKAYLESIKIVDRETQRVHDILLQVVSLLKHSDFKDEAEWRLVSDSVPAEYLHYDERDNKFFPYAPYDFDDSLREVKLRLPDSSMSALGLRGFLASKQNKNAASVSLSKHAFSKVNNSFSDDSNDLPLP